MRPAATGNAPDSPMASATTPHWSIRPPGPPEEEQQRAVPHDEPSSVPPPPLFN
jgi:hypothetical protein